MSDDADFEAFYTAIFGPLVGQVSLITGDLHDAEVSQIPSTETVTVPAAPCGPTRAACQEDLTDAMAS